MDNEVDWSKLPADLWPKIGKCLDNRMDVSKFRSVCETFRSSIIPSLPNSASFPMRVPQPLNPAADALVRETTIYVIEPTDGTSKLEPLAPSSKGWLVKIGKSKKHHRFTLMSPISDSKILQPLSTSAPIMWNLLDFRVIELGKSYTMHCKGRYSPPVTKVVFFPNSPWVDVKNSMACCIFSEGMLGFMKHGDEKWTLVDETNFFYDDIIVFKGQFYVTDKLGTISWVDTSSIKLIQFSPLLYGFGYKKHLVESCGSLYVVDRLFEGDRYIRRNYVGTGDVVRVDRDAAMECFKVYKLDEEWGTWVDVKNLRDRAFILATGCNFSVSANELTGYQRNCIYFTDGHRVRGYNLDDRSIIFHEFDPCIDKSLTSRDPSKRVGPHFEIQTII